MLDAQIIPDEGALIILRTDLNFVPIFLVIDLLLLGRQPHQDEVSDFVTFTEVESCRVQAFKNELRIVIPIQSDIDDLQTANRIIKLVNGNLLLLNPVVEIIVIHSQIGLADVLCGIREQLTESLLVILDRLELDASILRLPLDHEIFFEYTLFQIGSLRHDDTFINQVIHGKEQQ